MTFQGDKVGSGKEATWKVKAVIKDFGVCPPRE